MPITATATLTTPHGDLTVNFHEGPHSECLSLVCGSLATPEPLLVRLHSACLFGEAIGDQTCDCGPQLHAALAQISAAGRGVLLYLFQEGRGIGLKDKIRAMELHQREGLNTHEAMLRLGYAADMRSYDIAAMALSELQAPTQIRLMSNNPAKRQGLEDNGFAVVEMVSLAYELSPQAHTNLHNKVELLGHSIDFSRLIVDNQTPDAVAKLAEYIQSLSDFKLVERGEPYRHIGAVIADAILQSGMQYDSQVLPRVMRIAADPDAATSSGFLRLLETEGPEVVVQINGKKAYWVQQFAHFLVEKRLETVDDLRMWLYSPDAEQQLLALNGVGLKTANYVKLLAGMRESVAVDTHIHAFLAAAGIAPTDDRTAGAIVAGAAALLNTSPSQLDASIWRYRARPSRAE